MSYSGYLYYTSQDKLSGQEKKCSSLLPQFTDVEAACESCKAALGPGNRPLKAQQKHVSMGIPYVMIVISLVQVRQNTIN